jgi:class 3 adenylate cyclase/alpha-beta hydrolase superfamily lysophospholipase
VPEVPQTRFTRIGGDRIAYQVLGEGPCDLLYVLINTACVDLPWEWPPYAQFLRGLASFSRLIMFDARGVGASDPVSNAGLPRWEDWADDARAVLDAVGSEHAAIWAGPEAGPVALLFAATRPERTRSLVLFSTTARFRSSEDYPWGLPRDVAAGARAFIIDAWGTEDMATFANPTAARDPAFRRWFAKMQRAASNARQAAATLSMIQSMDVRHVLPSVRAPTLVIHRADFRSVPVEQGRYLVEHLPDARLIVVPGSDGAPYSESVEEILQETETFLTGVSGQSISLGRVLAAVLFTDIVGSTELAAAVGDRRWRNLLETHDAVTRTVVEQYAGRLVKSTGDGVLALFDGPGRAIRCAYAIRDALQPLGIEIRAGLHTGEIERNGDDVVGIGVHVAARVLDQAGPGEVLVSGAVPPLVVGSGIEFNDLGERELNGVPGPWRLFSVVS